MHKVLVLDANQRSALAIIRSLGRRGLRLVAGDHVPKSIGGASKYVAESVLYPDPTEYPSSFVCEIAAIARRFEIDIIVPATDVTTMLLASQPELQKIVRVAAPPPASYEALSSKARLLELANKLSILIPETKIAHTRVQVIDAARKFGYPVVLKPARSRYLKSGRITSTAVTIVTTPSQLLETVDRLSWLDDIPCLVQRYIPGHGAGIFALYGGSRPIAWFSHRRIREKPPTGGVSVLSESVHIDSTMQAVAEKLLSEVGWVGVAMVEFRVSTDGKPYLMEVNGRFWGSLQLSINCGVDFPWLLYQQTQGLRITSPAPYAAGRRLRWLLGDVDSLILELRGRENRLIRKVQKVGAFLQSFLDPYCRQEVWRFSDPCPAVLEAQLWVKALWRIRPT